MRFVAIAALLAVCAGLSAQAYTVTSGALPSPYAGVANPTPAGLAHNQYTLPISPPGFQIPFFGGSFSSFQIASAGFISLSGAMQSVPSTPAPDQNGGLVIAPLWCDLAPGNTLVSPIAPGLPVAGHVSWAFNAGVLGVEWWNVPIYNGMSTNSVGVRMLLLLDTNNGEIEFRYGAVHNGTTGVTTQHANAVCIADLVGIVPQVVIPGQDTPNVNANGSVSTYPVNRYIRFTPTGSPVNTPPTIAVAYNDPIGGPTQVVHQGTITVAYGQSVSGLAFDIEVDDADADNCSLAANITNLGSTGIVTTQWESASAPVPFNVLPTGGTFNTLLGASHSVTLTADDGADTTVFTFTLVQDPAPPNLGVAAGASAITSGQAATGTNRDFGTRDITDGPSASLTVTIENTGGSDLMISNVNVAGDSADFDVQSGGLAATVPPGGNSSFTVAFDPATPGAKLITFSFDHNDQAAVSPFEIEFIGDAVHIVPVLVVREGNATGGIINHGGTVAFGTIDLALGASLTRTIFIENAGNGDLNLAAPTSSAAEFGIGATSFPAIVTPSGDTTFTITFQPAANGIFTETVVFDHDDPSVTNPFSITVTGTAITTETTTGGSRNSSSGGCAADSSFAGWWLLALAGAICGAVAVRARRVC